MGQRTLLVKLVGDDKNCKLVYRFSANPGMPRGGIVPPSPVLAPGSALGSRPRVVLSSAQVPRVDLRSGARGKSLRCGLGADARASGHRAHRLRETRSGKELIVPPRIPPTGTLR